MINTENFKMIKLNVENIFIFDDKYVFSKFDDLTQSDKPDYYTKIGLMFINFLGIMVLVFVVFIMIYLDIKRNINVTTPIILCLPVVIFNVLYNYYRRSWKSVIYKRDIIRIYINEKRNCVSFKFKEGKKRVKIRSVDLPLNINEKEKVLQTLYEHNLINKEFTSQIIQLRDGFMYIKDKTVSFVDLKLYSKNIDAKRYVNEMYQLFVLLSFTLLASIVASVLMRDMIYCLIICIIVATTFIVYLIILYKQFINSKTFLIRKNRIVDISVNEEDNQKVVIKYYNKRKQLKQKELFLPDDEQEKNDVDFIKKCFPNNSLNINSLSYLN